MAIFSTHLLNSLNGTHASKVQVNIIQIDSKGERKLFFDEETDENGRIFKEFNLTSEDCLSTYEMIIKINDYFSQYINSQSKKIVSEVVVKFNMAENKKKYHIPIIISPNSYSIWWSE